MPFAKFDGGLILAQEFVSAPDYTLLASERAAYQLPIDGWDWYDSDADARAALQAAPNSAPPQ